jgi:hypothetical protein
VQTNGLRLERERAQFMSGLIVPVPAPPPTAPIQYYDRPPYFLEISSLKTAYEEWIKIHETQGENSNSMDKKIS